MAAGAAWAQDDYSDETSTDQAGTTETMETTEETMSTDQAGDVMDETTQESATVDESGEMSDEAGQAGMDTTAGTTTATADEATRGLIKKEKVAIRPQAGVIVFEEGQTSDTSSRFAAGLTVDMNALSTFLGESTWYLGPSSGLIYSHVGADGSNFFGTDANNPASAAGANFFYIPLNLKAGYNIGDRFRVAVHGGGNLTYRSVGNSMNLGDATAVQNSTWRTYPNAGIDLESNLGQNIALTLRPDVMFTPGAEVFSGTLAVAIPLG